MNQKNTENIVPNVNSKEKEERNVPDLRFKEFYLKWEKTKIGNHIKEIKKFTSNFIQYPLYSFTIESGVTPKTDRYERSFLVKKNGDLFKIISHGEFIMNPMNLRFGAINYSNQCQAVSVSGYYNIFELYERKYNDFWNYYLKTKKTLARYNSIATGSLSEKKRVHFSQFINMIFYIPSDNEMKKINDFLGLIDHRIEAQKKIIEEIKFYKKYILNKIFIDKGLLIEGKEMTLNNVLIPGDKEPVNTSLYRKINVHLNLNGISYATVTRKMSDIRPFYLRHKGELIIGKQNYFNGSIAIIPEKYDNTICSNAIMSFMIKKEYDDEFIYYAISNNSFLKFRSHIANGTGQKELSEKDFLNFKIKIPVLARQKIISNSLRAIEDKIINEEKILKLYLKQKDYLLNKMFI